jgi:hypothetical protein
VSQNRDVGEEKSRHRVLGRFHYTLMEYHLVMKGPLARERIRPGICEGRRRAIAPQLELRNVALNRDAPGGYPHDLGAQKDCPAIVQELHGRLQRRAFGVLHWSADSSVWLRFDCPTLSEKRVQEQAERGERHKESVT